MLYIPDIGDNVLPVITINDTGWATSYFLTDPGITIVKSPVNCEAIALTSFIIFAVWNTSVKLLLQLFTTWAPWAIALPLPSTANPTCEKFMSVILYAIPLYDPDNDNMFVLEVPNSNVSLMCMLAKEALLL